MAAAMTVRIDDLHPTQLTLGLAEVQVRARAMAALPRKELKALLKARPVPYVIGPAGQFYLIDHHHLCRALHQIGRRRVVLGDCRADWSDLDLRSFWLRMEAEGFCWPIDAEGNRRPWRKIPRHVADLTDNPWRSLARGLRGRAYTNEDTPFQEFMWGDYFRTFMTQRLLLTSRPLAEKLAMGLARLDEAQDLPGYLGSG